VISPRLDSLHCILLCSPIIPTHTGKTASTKSNPFCTFHAVPDRFDAQTQRYRHQVPLRLTTINISFTHGGTSAQSSVVASTVPRAAVVGSGARPFTSPLRSPPPHVQPLSGRLSKDDPCSLRLRRQRQPQQQYFMC
jgi:hypothetical protein